MSDYMFMLESHLSPEQNQVVSQVEAAAEQVGVRVFLAGGAMRDMLGGFPIRDLDFVVEGNSQRVIHWLTRKMGAEELWDDDGRRAAELRFANGARAEISMAHDARYGKPGSKPAIRPATIHDDLCGRDFTINSVALSLNKASRGLLLDPTNGLGDLERRELRANSSQTIYDDPSRMLRMFRLRVRMNLEIDPRTRAQYESARQVGLEKKIPARRLLEELRKIADEPNPELVLAELDREKLLTVFSPAMTGAKLNEAGFARLSRVRQTVPFGIPFRAETFGLFFHVLTEKWTPNEKNQLVKNLGIPKKDIEAWNKLAARVKKLESTLKSAKLNRASLVYKTLREVPGEDILLLAMRSGQRLVQDRLKNYLQKYLLGASEITERDLAHLALRPGTPQFAKAHDEMIFAYLDGRIRKPAPEEATEPVAAASRR
jgi:tRNA nucleotidyltransferase/poly(A) polymerase